MYAILPVSQVAYILMYCQTATYNEHVKHYAFPTLSYLTMHSEKLSFLYTPCYAYYLLQSQHVTVIN
jgi:hypothetical protein